MNNLMKGSIVAFILSLILFIYSLNNNTKYYSTIVRPDITITYRDPSNIMGRFIKEYLYDKNGNVYISYKPLIYRGHIIVWYKWCYLKFKKIPFHNYTQIDKIIYCRNYPNRKYY